MARKSVPLTVEELDGRIVPSAAQPLTGPLPPVQIHPTHPLTGRGSGTYLSKHGNPDVGATDTVKGAAHLEGMGQATVVGTIHAPGFIANAAYSGTMTFRNANGAVTVALTSFRPAGPAGLPVWYRYHITKATGTYSGMKDSGSLRLDVTLNPATGSNMDRTGTFRVTI